MQQLRKSRSISLSIWQEIRYRLTHKFEKIEFDVRFVNRHFHSLLVTLRAQAEHQILLETIQIHTNG